MFLQIALAKLSIFKAYIRYTTYIMPNKLRKLGLEKQVLKLGLEKWTLKLNSKTLRMPIVNKWYY